MAAKKAREGHNGDHQLETRSSTLAETAAPARKNIAHDIGAPLTQVMRHISPTGFTRASLLYRWYEASWFRDSSMMAIGLTEATEFLRSNQDPRCAETQSAAGSILGFLWGTIGKFDDSIRAALAIDASSKEFLLLKNHIPARMGENGQYFSFTSNGVEYSDAQENNTYIKLRQYDSVPLTLIATHKFIEMAGENALDPAIKERIRGSLDNLVQYMLKTYRTPSANAWELDEGEMHSYTVASISGGLRSAIFLSQLLGANIGDLKELNAKVKEVDAFIEDTFVRDGILYKSANTPGTVPAVQGPNRYVDASAIFVFTLFKPQLSAGVEANTIKKMEDDLFDGNVLPIRYLGDTYFSGGRWPLLGLEFAHYYAEHGDFASALRILDYVKEKHLGPNGGGVIPEQELVNPACPNSDLHDWFKKNGNVVISELGWAEAEYVKAVITYVKEEARKQAGELKAVVRGTPI